MKPRAVLAVDTTSDVLSLAASRGGRIWRRRVRAVGLHDEKIFPEARRLLARAGLRWSDLDALAAASGPGSFTGVRVGMTFVAVLAASLGRPAVAVSLLEAEALAGWTRTKGAQGRVVAAVFPGKGEDLYFQAFDSRRRMRPMGPPQRVAPPASWLESLPRSARRREVLLVGPAAERAASKLGASGVRAEASPSAPVEAGALIPVALDRLSRGKSPGDFAPLYLQPAYYERSAR